MKRSLFILLLLFIFSGCDGIWLDHDDAFMIRNTTDENLYLYVSYFLPDAGLPAEKPNLTGLGNGKNNISAINDCDVRDSGFRRLKKGELLSVFFILRDTVDTKPWSYIRDNQVILDRYDLSWEVITNYNYYVPYPLR